MILIKKRDSVEEIQSSLLIPTDKQQAYDLARREVFEKRQTGIKPALCGLAGGTLYWQEYWVKDSLFPAGSTQWGRTRLFTCRDGWELWSPISEVHPAGIPHLGTAAADTQCLLTGTIINVQVLKILTLSWQAPKAVYSLDRPPIGNCPPSCLSTWSLHFKASKISLTENNAHSLYSTHL